MSGARRRARDSITAQAAAGGSAMRPASWALAR